MDNSGRAARDGDRPEEFVAPPPAPAAQPAATPAPPVPAVPLVAGPPGASPEDIRGAELIRAYVAAGGEIPGRRPDDDVSLFRLIPIERLAAAILGLAALAAIGLELAGRGAAPLEWSTPVAESQAAGSAVHAVAGEDLAAAAPYQVDLNTAAWWEISLVPGLGETLAKRIVQRREQVGPYNSRRELLEIHGIGPIRLEEIGPYFRLGAAGDGPSPGPGE